MKIKKNSIVKFTLHWQCDSHTPPAIVPRISHEHCVQLGPLYPGKHSEHFGPAKPGLHVQAPPIPAHVPIVPTGLLIQKKKNNFKNKNRIFSPYGNYHSHGTHGCFTFGDTPNGRK